MPTRTKNRSNQPQPGRSKTVTLQDVAAVAGVTAMTVSRVIKGGGNVAPATRERVLDIVRELNYTVNLSARALATGRTGVIGVISATLNQSYYASIVSALEAHITDNGYQMRLLHNQNDLNNLLGSTSATAVDGTLIAGQYGLVEQFRARDPRVFSPCVFIDTQPHPGADFIHSDLEPAVRAALQLMARAGRERLAYVGHIGSRPTPAQPEERMGIYLRFMKEWGRAPEIVGVGEAFLTRATLRNYFDQRGCPGALFCVNDETAMYVYRALRDAGCRIPDDALLVGCDGLPFMECFDPPLSTIAHPLEQICETAWRFLSNRIENPGIAPQTASFEARLVVRASLQSPAEI